VKLAPNTSIGPRNSIKFEYDWQGRRIHKQVWGNTNWTSTPTNDVKFVYDGWNLLAELNATNNAVIRSFMWGSDLSGSIQGAGGVGGLLEVTYKGTQATNCFVAFDGNGNVAALADAGSTNILAQYEYGPFGEVLRATGPLAKANPFRFSTKYQDDETDLLYYGYRYYGASTGRWISRDPAGAVNLYSFARNNGVSGYDFLGLWDYRVHYFKTYGWATQLGISSGTANMIGGADQLIDDQYPVYRLFTDGAIVIFSDSNWSWHFNRSADPSDDSRLTHRDEGLRKAQERCNASAGNDDSYGAAIAIGRALHPYQDIFAHGDFNRKMEMPSMTGASGLEDLRYCHNFDEDGFPFGYWTSFPKPDEPTLDTNGPGGVPTMLSGVMFIGTTLSNGDATYYSHFHTGSERITTTEKASKEFMSQFQAYVRENSKPCGQCQKAFLGGN